jgi:putative intracellular protease/amidase
MTASCSGAPHLRDGNLITGQQNFSGAETAEVVIAALGE